MPEHCKAVQLYHLQPNEMTLLSPIPIEMMVLLLQEALKIYFKTNVRNYAYLIIGTGYACA